MTRSAVAAALLWGFLGQPCTATCRSPDPGAPRVLILALDGVAFRTVERARELGGFAGWSEPEPLVSTFPSMTNVAFTAMFQPFGLELIAGYEIRHFDSEENRMVGGPLQYKKWIYGWKDLFQIVSRSRSSKISLYGTPKKKAWKVVAQVEQMVLESPDDLMLAHTAATDVLHHFRGDEVVASVLRELSERLDRLEARHLEVRGRPLRVVLLSDHGNTLGKVRHAKGLLDELRGAGLRVVSRLQEPNDVVAPSYGFASYGTLFLRPEIAETAGRAVARNEAVDLAAWLSGEGQITVVSRNGEAHLQWRGDAGERSIAYRPRQGDPLRLAEARSRLVARDLLREKGYAREDDWLAVTASSDFPDAPRRLVDALAGTYVTNSAPVLFSLAPGYAWGPTMTRMGAKLLGGLEGTHGGLDRESSLGFFLINDPSVAARNVVAAHRAVEEWAEYADCLGLADLHAP